MSVPSRSTNTARLSFCAMVLPGQQFLNTPNAVRGGDERHQREELDPSSIRLNNRRFRDRLAEGRRIIGALAMDIRLQVGKYPLRSEIVENEYVVDAVYGC